MDAAVFANEDLRRYIMSYLRSEPRRVCRQCKDVLVWDKQVKFHIAYYDNDKYSTCTDCFAKSFNGPGCAIS